MEMRLPPTKLPNVVNEEQRAVRTWSRACMSNPATSVGNSCAKSKVILTDNYYFK